LALNSTKRVLLYRFDRLPVEGFVAGPLTEGFAELITVGGNLHKFSPADVKALCFISEPGKSDLFSDRNAFERRPKLPGLWVRFTLRDEDQLDGVLAHNLLDWPGNGFLAIPPRAGPTRQRVYLPRTSITSTELLGVIGKPAGRMNESKAEESLEQRQLTIFDLQP
jgi:hypothetical protein